MYVPRAFAYALPLLLLALLVPPPDTALAQDPQLIELPGIEHPFSVKTGTVLPDGSVILQSQVNRKMIKVTTDGKVLWQENSFEVEVGFQNGEGMIEVLDDGGAVQANIFILRNERGLFLSRHDADGDEVFSTVIAVENKWKRIVAVAVRDDGTIDLMALFVEAEDRYTTQSTLAMVTLRDGQALPMTRVLKEWECLGARNEDPDLLAELTRSPDGSAYLFFSTTTVKCRGAAYTSHLMRLNEEGGIIWEAQLPDAWWSSCRLLVSEDGKSIWLGPLGASDKKLYQISAEGELLAEVDIPDDWDSKAPAYCRSPLSATSEGEALIWSGMAKEQEVGFVAKITAEDGVVWTVEHRLLGRRLHIGRGRLLPDGSRLHAAFVSVHEVTETSRPHVGPRLFRFRPPEE
jgi:hypothetical protein